MKIIKLSFGNINSLAGIWSIDFEHPSFSEGLFALTGPTGAGKTSVLDAICLALYGQTVREDISSDHNEVMTRGTGKCFAEVTFEVESSRYRCRWSQRRARENPAGDLQNATREIVEVATGTVLASQLRQVELKISGLTGMSFEQFTRSVLLAQGQFDTFLKAKDSERADILEKITDTGIFSKIGAAVFARFQEERQKKEDLERAQAAIVVMPREVRQQLDEQLAEAEKVQAGIQGELEVLARQTGWLLTISNLQQSQATLAAQTTELEAVFSANQSDFIKLQIAETARKFDLDLQAIENQRSACSQAAQALASRDKQCRERKDQLLAIVPKLSEATTAAHTARYNLEQALPKLAAMRELDKQIDLAEQDMKNAASLLAVADQQHKEAVTAQREATTHHATATNDLNQAVAYQQTHELDSRIGILLPPIETRHSAWGVLKRNAGMAQAQAVEKEKAAKLANKKAVDAVSRHELDEKLAISARLKLAEGADRLNTAKTAYQVAEKIWQAAEQDWKLQKNAIEKSCELAETALLLARQVASYEEARQQLADGCECPLCGSKTHPYAEGNRPVVSGAERELMAIKAARDQLVKKVETARAVYDEAAKALQDHEELDRTIRSACEKAVNQAELSAQFAQTATETAQASQLLACEAGMNARSAGEEAEHAWACIGDALASLAVSAPQPSEWAVIVESLKKRQAEFDAQVKLAHSATVRIQAARHSLEQAGQRLQTAITAMSERKSGLRLKESALADLITTRRTQYGDLKPDAEESLLRLVAEKTDKKQGDIANEKATLDQALLNAQQEVERAQSERRDAESGLAESLQVGLAKFQAAGFVDEATCRSARWVDSEIVRVAALRKELETKAVELKTKRESTASDLATERAKALTARSHDDLLADTGVKQKLYKACGEVAKDLEFKIRSDDENRTKQALQGTALETQKAIFARWKKMNEMIGNDGGVRFKKYAQGITLNRLLKVANPHLASMTNNRYALVWNVNDGDTLLPAIIDNHQAEARRPVSNLSGGETFMVSLALALGLSGMASGRLHVDSLFLDEGFGTLDNEALDRAIGTLNQLHQTQGKLIGVISHIDQLKNQITTKIEVTKVGNGRSTLSGPGVGFHVPVER